MKAINMNCFHCFYCISLRTGHTSAPSHLRRLNLVADDQCECGIGIADPDHLILRCPITETGRNEMLYKMEEVLKSAPKTVEDILKGNQQAYQHLAAYLQLNEMKF